MVDTSEHDRQVGDQGKIGSVQISTVSQVSRRMSMLLWGPPGGGKTTLACTAPGKKLLVNFDPDGYGGLGDRDDVLIYDTVKEPDSILESLRTPTMLTNYVKDNGVKTVILDSTTTMSERGLAYGVTQIRGATIDAPTLQGYGKRNTIVLDIVSKFLVLTAKLDCHIVVVAHEGATEKDEQTGALFVSLLLGGALPSLVPIKFSEVWHVEDTGKDRRITVRSSRSRKPMKSRMFMTNDKADFPWKYNPVTNIGTGISDWYDAWSVNNFNKLKLPV